MSAKRSVSATWTRLVIEALEDSGLDTVSLCDRAGIDLSDLKNPYSRFSQDSLTRLWSAAVEETGNPSIGLVLANRQSIRQLDAMVYSFISSLTLKESFERLRRFQHIMSESIELKIYQTDEGYFVDFKHYGDELPPTPQTIDASFAASSVIMDWVSTETVRPIRVELTHSNEENRSAYERIFACPIVFNAEANRVLFSVEDFERPIPTANEYMAKFHEDTLQEMLQRTRSKELFLQVKEQMLKELPTGNATIENMSMIFNMTQRTFQRRLKEEGWTFRDLLDSTRKELAKEYLCKEDLSADTITHKLGFAESTAFIRAFKRWYGNTPSRFKKTYLGKEQFTVSLSR